MKLWISIVLVVATVESFSASLSLDASSPSFDEVVVSEIGQLFENQDYAGLYERLDVSYTRWIKRDAFISQLASSGVRIEKMDVRAASVSEGGGYMIVSQFKRTKEGVIGELAVIFAKNYQTGWKLMNFPWTPGYLPEFYEPPCFVKKNGA